MTDNYTTTQKPSISRERAAYKNKTSIKKAARKHPGSLLEACLKLQRSVCEACRKLQKCMNDIYRGARTTCFLDNKYLSVILLST